MVQRRAVTNRMAAKYMAASRPEKSRFSTSWSS